MIRSKEAEKGLFRGASAGFLLLCLLVPAVAQATFIDGLGVGARPMAMGSAYTAVSDDLMAIYYNPAGLAQIERHEILLGYLWSGPSLNARPLSGGSFHVEQVVPYELKTPVIAVGFNVDRLFKEVLPLHLRVGVLTLIPDNFQSAYRLWDPDPSTPRWVRAGDYWDRIHLLGAISLQPEGVPWISVGVGFCLIASGRGDLLPRYGTSGADLVLRGLSGEVLTAEGNLDIEVDHEAAPTAGVMLTPIQGLRLGYCFRNSFSLVAGSNTAAIEAHILVGEKEWVVPLVPAVTFEGFYVPQQHNFGAAYQWNERLLISFDLSWFRWSDYASESRGTPDPPWQDTIIPRLGIEVRPWKALALRLGYFFEPSPVAEQNRGSNYLDNDRHAFSFGAGYTFADPLQIVREAMEVDLVVHYIHMPSRRTVKEAGFSPDFETEGEILSVGGNVTFRF